jgi:tetratricopeptide (TPR) repeat protein
MARRQTTAIFKGKMMTTTLTAVQTLQSEALRLLDDGNDAAALERCHEALGYFSGDHQQCSPRAAFVLYSVGTIFERAGTYREAGECARRALAMIESFPSERDEITLRLLRLRALTLIGTALRQLGEYSQAEPALRSAVEIAEALPDRPEERANAWNNLGMLCKYAGWFERGEEAYAQAIEAAARMTRHRDGTTANILHNIGGIRHARGQFDIAEEPARRAWEMRRELLGEDHSTTLADATAYAAVLDGLRRYVESRAIYERALDIHERVFGPEHYEMAAALHNLALVEEAEGNHPRAVEFARRSWGIKAKLYGDDHPDTALSAMNLASLVMDENREEAHKVLNGALATFVRTLAPDHPHTSLCRRLIAKAQR